MGTTRTTRATRVVTPVAEMPFAIGDLRRVRAFVADLAAEAGLGRGRTDELTVVINELAANSVDHGGGAGTVRGWVETEALVVEVEDAGRIADPVGAGRVAPRPDQARGRGLWIARRLSDSLDIRPTPRGTVVRVVTWR